MHQLLSLQRTPQYLIRSKLLPDSIETDLATMENRTLLIESLMQ